MASYLFSPTLLFGMALAAPSVVAQPAETFEVASIKLGDPVRSKYQCGFPFQVLAGQSRFGLATLIAHAT